MNPDGGPDDLDQASLLEVFAFGSNLDPTDFNAWCMREQGLKPVMVAPFRGWLPGYSLCWNYFSPVRQGGAANICVAPDSAVAGVVFKVDKATLAALDIKEGHPSRYRRIRVSVQSMDQGALTRDVWTYSVTDEYRRIKPVPPTTHYLEVMLRGIEAQGLPASWREAVVESVRTLDR